MLTEVPNQSPGLVAPTRPNRALKLLIFGSSCSMLGSRVTTIAYPMLVLYLTGSPATAGLVAFAATAPSLLVYMPVGALVDRLDPRRTMLMSESGRGIAVGIVAIMLLRGRPSVILLIIVAVAEEILEVFSMLAERRYIRSLVDRDQAPSVLARIEGRTHVVVLTGRPLGAFLFELGHIFPFFLDTLSFIVSVLTLAGAKGERGTQQPLVTVPPARSNDRDRKGWGRNTFTRPYRWPDIHLKNDIFDSLRWLREEPYVKMIILLSASTTLISQALIMVFLAAAHGQHLPSLMVGVTLATSGIGGTLGSMLATRLKAAADLPLIQIQLWVWAAAFAALWIVGGKSFLPIAAVMTVLGFTGALSNIQFGTYLMDSVAETMLARVTSAGNLMSFAACAAGPAVGGILVQYCKVEKSVFSLLIMTIILAIISVSVPSVRSQRSRTNDRSSAKTSDSPQRAGRQALFRRVFIGRGLIAIRGCLRLVRSAVPHRVASLARSSALLRTLVAHCRRRWCRLADAVLIGADPAGVEAAGDALREQDPGDRAGGEVLGVEDVDLGAAGRLVVDEAEIAVRLGVAVPGQDREPGGQLPVIEDAVFAVGARGLVLHER